MNITVQQTNYCCVIILVTGATRDGGREHELVLRLPRQPDDPLRPLLLGLALEPLRVSGQLVSISQPERGSVSDGRNPFSPQIGASGGDT